MSAVASRPASRRPVAAEAATSVPPVALEHEELAVRRGRRSGRYMAIAVHSTALGPALGGVRLWRYADPADGIRDALRLARGMTMKAAVAGLDLGGGKGVICAPPTAATPPGRRDLLLDFGDLVESLGGRYVTAEDVGITPADLEIVAERTSHVTGLGAERGGSGDPSPFTAAGVEAAMRACARERLGSPDLAGLTVAISGLGHVGSRLARRLADAGALLVVSDIDESRQAVAAEIGARWVDSTEIISTRCHILAPCALGGAIHAGVLDSLRAKVVCGCANNQLADEGLAGELADRDILYAPDYVVNAGGLIHVYREIADYSEAQALELVHGIETTLAQVFEIAADEDITPLAAASRLARERLSAGADVPRLTA
jgi:leucine dehydrogenase